VPLLKQRDTLLQQRIRLEAKIKALPKAQRETIGFMRDVEVNQAIYLQLLSKKQELSIVETSTVGNVRKLDNAVVYIKPIKPKKPLIVVIATLLGGMLSVAFLLIKAAFHRGIETPDQIEEPGSSVYATIPKSDAQVPIDKYIEQKNQRKQSSEISQSLSSEVNAAYLAVEALRNLRQFAFLHDGGKK
jgi:tyrosine-protein kinase Etk/Wzc